MVNHVSIPSVCMCASGPCQSVNGLFMHAESQETCGEGRKNSEKDEAEECEFISEKDVLSYARQVALGMVNKYLAIYLLVLQYCCCLAPEENIRIIKFIS